MGKELELKLTASMPETLEALWTDGDVARMRESSEDLDMATTYFDTAAGDLSARKWMLRIRKENDDYVVTLKTPGDGLCRGEWEYPGSSLGGGAEKLIALGAPAELKELLSQGAVPVCGASFFRKAALLRFEDGSAAELALDLGTLYKGKTQAPICEAELELKEGDPAAMLAFGETLAQRYGLQKETRGKFPRALALE